MSASGVFDSLQQHEHFFVIPERIYVLVELDVWLHFRQFWAPATAADAGGTATAGPSSAATTEGGGSSTPTTDGGPHIHTILQYLDDTPAANPTRDYKGGGSFPSSISLPTSTNANVVSFEDTPNHEHSVTIASHTHPMPHNHGIDPHDHALEWGIFKEPMPATIDVNLGVWRKPFTGGAWTLLGSVSGISDEEVYLDLMQVVGGSASVLPGLWRLTLQSAAGAPQGGRLTVDVAGAVLGAIKSS